MLIIQTDHLRLEEDSECDVQTWKYLSAIFFTNESKVELGKILNIFETHDIISAIWVDKVRFI